MGDPTLRMYPVAPPSSLSATPDRTGRVTLAWTGLIHNIRDESPKPLRIALQDTTFIKQVKLLVLTIEYRMP